VVASAIVNGTSKILANVCAKRVLPHPVGPTKRIFDFESSTSLLFYFHGLIFYNDYEPRQTKLLLQKLPIT